MSSGGPRQQVEALDQIKDRKASDDEPGDGGFLFSELPAACAGQQIARAKDKASHALRGSLMRTQILDHESRQLKRIANARLADFDYFPCNEFGDRVASIFQAERSERFLICRNQQTDFFRAERRVLQYPMDCHPKTRR